MISPSTIQKFDTGMGVGMLKEKGRVTRYGTWVLMLKNVRWDFLKG